MRVEGNTEAERVDFFSELYGSARMHADDIYAKMDKHYRQYRGSREIDSPDGIGTGEPATVVRNITFEIIESQITGYIPNPSVTAKTWSEQNERCAKSIERLLVAKRNELPYEMLNDQDERYCPIYGGSVWYVLWDESKKTHNTVGDIDILCLPPKRFTGQPNMYRVEDMEYLFLEFDTTREEIMRKYNVSQEKADEAELSLDSDVTSEDDNTVTLYICYYRDDDGNICEYVWSGDTELSDTRDFYARKRKLCKKCGKREGLCECEKPKFELENEEYEELDKDIHLSDGTVIPARSIVIKDGVPVTHEEERQALDAMGQPVFDNIGGTLIPRMVKVQVPDTEKTRIPFYKPKMFPVIIRKNTSEEESLFGNSDCEQIRPQQQAINKLESRIMQKMMRGGVQPYIPEDADIDLDSDIFDHPIRIAEKHKGLIGVLDLQVDISRDAAASERHYDHAKRIIGISDSFQGQYDSSAKSGVAKQAQIQQAQGRLDSKRRMKNFAHSEIDRSEFLLYLAYADEPRPASYKDAQGRWQNVSFNRYDFLRRDENGEYYYNDEFLFSADASVDVESQREFLWQENRQNFQTGAYGDPKTPQAQLIYWQNMERAHYPHARDNVERIQDEIERQAQAAQMQAQIDALATEVKNHEDYEEFLRSRQGGAANGN